MKEIFQQQSLLVGSDALTEGERGETNKQVLKWFYNGDPLQGNAKMASQVAIKDSLQKWVDKVERYQPGQGSMFGPAKKPTEDLMAGEITAVVDEGPSLFEKPKAAPSKSRSKAAPSKSRSKAAPSKSRSGKVSSRRIAKRDTLDMSDAEFDALTGKLNKIAARIAPMADLALYDTESVPYLKPASVGAYYHEESLIALALRSTEIDPQATLHHEAIHALRSYQLFSEVEWEQPEGARRQARLD